MSQQTLGHRAGLTSEAISLLERGLRMPRATTIRLLADALRLSDDEREALFASATSRVPAEYLLPRYGDALIDRDRHVSHLAGVLQSEPARLVTVTGPGGVGKTRIAVAAAHLAKPHFPAGVRWVVATRLTTADELMRAVARSVGAAATGEPLAAIVQSIHDTRMLLVIDGADHLVGGVAAVAERLLAETSALTMLVTSRQSLSLPAEMLIVVPPLALPRLAADGSPLDNGDSAASRLFMARASLRDRQDQRNSRASSTLDVAAIARICHQVDGLPLALEAAAAQTTVLTVAELANALATSLTVLNSAGNADRSLIDIIVGDSFSSLGADEQTLLARLSVFTNRFTQADISALADPGSSATEWSPTLSLLVAKSLVIREQDTNGNATFRLLRIIREFASERLAKQRASVVVRRRFAAHVVDLAREAGWGLTGRTISTSASAMDAHAGDLDRALAWSIEHDQDAALTLVGAQWRWWQLRGHYESGRSAAGAALRTGRRRPAELRAPAYTVAGLLALLQSDYEGAQAHIQEGLDLYAESQDTSGLRWSLTLLGSIAQERGDYTVSDQLHRQSLVLATRVKDGLATAAQFSALGQVALLQGDHATAEDYGQQALELAARLGDQLTVTIALTDLGTTARYRGDLREAGALLTHSLALSRRIGFREGTARSLHQLGVVSRLTGNLDAAEGQQRTSSAEHRALGNRWRLAAVLDERAALAVRRSDPTRANRWLTSADQLRREIQVPVPPVQVSERTETQEWVRSLLGSTYRADTLTSIASATG